MRRDHMEEKKEELIDLSKVSHRELLIMLHKDVKELKVNAKENNAQHHTMELKLNTLETKAKFWGGFAGFFSAIGALFIERSIR